MKSIETLSQKVSRLEQRKNTGTVILFVDDDLPNGMTKDDYISLHPETRYKHFVIVSGSQDDYR